MAALESEKAELVQSMSKVEAELEAQRQELQRAQSSLATERESGVKAAEALQNQLNEKVRHSPDQRNRRLARAYVGPDGECSCLQESREQALESQLVAARWSSLRGAVEEAEKIVQDSLSQIDDPAHISCTSSAGGRQRLIHSKLEQSSVHTFICSSVLQTTWHPGVKPLWIHWTI